jgi:hypothetical protein
MARIPVPIPTSTTRFPRRSSWAIKLAKRSLLIFRSGEPGPNRVSAGVGDGPETILQKLVGSRLARIQTKRRGSGDGDKGGRPHKCHAKHRTRHRRLRRNTSTKIVSVVCACGQTALAQKPPALAGLFHSEYKNGASPQVFKKGTPWNVF